MRQQDRKCRSEKGKIFPHCQLSLHYSWGIVVIAEFGARQAPGWSEKRSRSRGFREAQAWRGEKPQAPR